MSAVTPADGPVVVTGASGYDIVAALVYRGHDVRACVTDPTNPAKTEHLTAIGEAEPGTIELCRGNLVEDGSYDAAVDGCAAVVHAGAAMAYGGKAWPQQVHDTAIGGTRNLVGSVKRAGTVRRFIYTSSFAAIHHPARAGYVFTEDDWTSDGRDGDPAWNTDDLDAKGETGYSLAKERTELFLHDAANAAGTFDVVSINPIVVLGPLLSVTHELSFSWQWNIARMLQGKECRKAWQHLWNIVDVRDVGSAHALTVTSNEVSNGDRFILGATDDTGQLDLRQIQTHLHSGSLP